MDRQELIAQQIEDLEERYLLLVLHAGTTYLTRLQTRIYNNSVRPFNSRLSQIALFSSGVLQLL